MNYYANCAAVDQKSPHISDPPLNKKPGGCRVFYLMAEREGFEPSIKFPLYALSRGAPSATRPPLQNRGHNNTDLEGTEARF